MDKKSIAALVVGAVLAASAYFAGGATVADAFTLAFDKNKATAYCTDLLKKDAESKEPATSE